MREPGQGTNIHLIWSKGLTDQYQTIKEIASTLLGIDLAFPIQSIAVHLKNLIQRHFVETEIDEFGQNVFRLIAHPVENDNLIKRTSIDETYLIILKLFESGDEFSAVKIKQITGIGVAGIKKTIKLLFNKKKIKKTGNGAYVQAAPRAYGINKNEVIGYLQSQVGKEFRTKDLVDRFNLTGTGIYATLGVLKKAGKIEETGQFKGKAVYTVKPSIDPDTKALTPVLPEYSPDITQMSIADIMQNIMVLRDENIRLKQLLESIGGLLVQAGVGENG